MKLDTRKTIVALAIGSVPMMANALSLEDYTVANSAYDEAYISGTLNANEPAGDGPNDRLGYNYSLIADYEKNFSTLPRSWSYGLTLDAGGSKSDQKTSVVTGVDATGAPTTTTVANDSTNDWGIRADGVIDTYFHESAYPKAFWFGLFASTAG